MTHGDALRCEAQGGTAMKRPNAAGSVLQGQQLFATARMLSRMEQNLKARAPRKTQRNQPG